MSQIGVLANSRGNSPYRRGRSLPENIQLLIGVKCIALSGGQIRSEQFYPSLLISLWSSSLQSPNDFIRGILLIVIGWTNVTNPSTPTEMQQHVT